MHDSQYCNDPEHCEENRHSLSEPDIQGFQTIKCEGCCTGIKVNMDAFNLPKEMVSTMSTAELLEVVQRLLNFRNEGLRAS